MLQSCQPLDTQNITYFGCKIRFEIATADVAEAYGLSAMSTNSSQPCIKLYLEYRTVSHTLNLGCASLDDLLDAPLACAPSAVRTGATHAC